MKEFDYYIFIDYSENLIGYNIIEGNKIKEILPRVVRIDHYKKTKHKKEYINSIKKLFEKERINHYILKTRILNKKNNIDLFSEIFEFIKVHNNCIIFISIDDFQFRTFKKLVKIVNDNKTKVVKESQLKKGSIEYKMSLIIDNQLNIIRKKNE